MPNTIAHTSTPGLLLPALFPPVPASGRSLNINRSFTDSSPFAGSALYVTAPSCPSEKSQWPVLSPAEGPVLANASEDSHGCC